MHQSLSILTPSQSILPVSVCMCLQANSKRKCGAARLFLCASRSPACPGLALPLSATWPQLEARRALGRSNCTGGQVQVQLEFTGEGHQGVWGCVEGWVWGVRVFEGVGVRAWVRVWGLIGCLNEDLGCVDVLGEE
jgi:hypothetical protein